MNANTKKGLPTYILTFDGVPVYDQPPSDYYPVFPAVIGAGVNDDALTALSSIWRNNAGNEYTWEIYEIRTTPVPLISQPVPFREWLAITGGDPIRAENGRNLIVTRSDDTRIPALFGALLAGAKGGKVWRGAPTLEWAFRDQLVDLLIDAPRTHLPALVGKCAYYFPGAVLPDMESRPVFAPAANVSRDWRGWRAEYLTSDITAEYAEKQKLCRWKRCRRDADPQYYQCYTDGPTGLAASSDTKRYAARYTIAYSILPDGGYLIRPYDAYMEKHPHPEKDKPAAWYVRTEYDALALVCDFIDWTTNL